MDFSYYVGIPAIHIHSQQGQAHPLVMPIPCKQSSSQAAFVSLLSAKSAVSPNGTNACGIQYSIVSFTGESLVPARFMLDTENFSVRMTEKFVMGTKLRVYGPNSGFGDQKPLSAELKNIGVQFEQISFFVPSPGPRGERKT